MSETRGGTHVYKFILIGNAGVGKTVAARSFAEGKPIATTQYKATIGVDYALKDISIGRSAASIQIWDIAGEQRFGTMTKTYFRGSHAVIIMFDLMNTISWEDVDIWRQDVLGKLGIDSSSDSIPVLIVGNKLDLVTPDRPAVVTDSELSEYVKKHNLWKGVKISARSDTIFGDNVIELTRMIHKSLEKKSPSDHRSSKEGPLKVIPSPSSSSPSEDSKRASKDSPVIKGKSVSYGSKPSHPEKSTLHGSNGDDDAAVYTHIEPPEKSGCCTIS